MSLRERLVGGAKEAIQQTAENAFKQVGELLEERVQLRAALKKVEWSGPGITCVECGGKRTNGHEADCLVGRVLAQS